MDNSYQLLHLAADLADEQFGLVTKGQLLNAGMREEQMRALVSDGTIELWDRNIYKIVDFGLHPFPELLSIQLSYVDKDGWPFTTFGYQTSLAVMELMPYDENDQVHIFTEGKKRLSNFDDRLVLHSETTKSGDLLFVDGLRITNLKRTLIDLYRCSQLFWPLVAEAYKRGMKEDLLSELDQDSLPKELIKMCERSSRGSGDLREYLSPREWSNRNIRHSH